MSRRRIMNDSERKARRTYSNQGFGPRKKWPPTHKPGLSSEPPPRRQLVAIAEGDSWFDFLPAFIGGGKDLLGPLQTTGRINVYRVSPAGGTIPNKV